MNPEKSACVNRSQGLLDHAPLGSWIQFGEPLNTQ